MKEIKVGQKVFLGRKEIGEIVESPNEGRFMIRKYNSEWKTDFYFFCLMHEGNIEIR